MGLHSFFEDERIVEDGIEEALVIDNFSTIAEQIKGGGVERAVDIMEGKAPSSILGVSILVCLNTDVDEIG